jgi:chemotaxis response regulator CheB
MTSDDPKRAAEAWAIPSSSDRVVVIASSAGSLDPLCELLTALGPAFPLPIVVVQHRGDSHPELLPELLARRTDLDVRHADSGDFLVPGTVYVCPPGAHITAEHSLRVTLGPKIDFVRPSADLMLASVARGYGPRAIAVVLSGRGSDGARGSIAVSGAGGTVLVQAPESSAFPAMPEAVIQGGSADQVLSPAEIGGALRALAEQASGTKPREAATIRVLLADDHRIILDGLRTLLGREKDIEIVGDVENGRDAVLGAMRLAPDVVVMDVAMPGLNGIDAMRRIKALLPNVRIVALSANNDRRTVIEAVRAGATGYLSKSAAFGELARAIRTISRGQSYFSPRMLAPDEDELARAALGTNVLSPIEREVLQLMAEGLELTEIALEMQLAVSEVQEHAAAIMRKLDMTNVANLTRYAIREGLTSA